MALEIEDGTGKANSQSYASASDARAFALLRGVVLSATDSVVESQLVAAMDYIEALEPRMKGSRTNANVYEDPSFKQALSWPRKGVVVNCDTLDEDTIPSALIAAQNHLVIAQFNGAVLMPVLDPNEQLIKRKKVDVLETEYFAPGEAGISHGTTPTFPVVDALLQPLLRAGGGTTAMAYRG